MAGFVAVAAGAVMPGVASSISAIFSRVGSVMEIASTQRIHSRPMSNWTPPRRVKPSKCPELLEEQASADPSSFKDMGPYHTRLIDSTVAS